MPVKITPKILVQRAPVTTSATLLYQPPDSTSTEIRSIFIANTTAGASTFSLYVDKNGVRNGTANALYNSVSVSANSTTLISFSAGAGLFLESSDSSISAKVGTATALTFTLFGLETEQT